VASVEQPDLRPQDREKLEAHLALARDMGAEVHSLKGDDFVGAILAFAHQERITQLFLGHTGRPRRVWFARSPIDRLIDSAEGFDVRLFPHEGSL
jgi:two-component system sensor histidine kinase KdpD